MDLLKQWANAADRFRERDAGLCRDLCALGQANPPSDPAAVVDLYDNLLTVARRLVKSDPDWARTFVSDDHPEHATAPDVLRVLTRGVMEDEYGDLKLALCHLVWAEREADRLQDLPLRTIARMARGRALVVHGDTRTAPVVLQEGADLAREIGARRQEAKCIGNLGFLYGELDGRAYEIHTRRALAIGQGLGDEQLIAHSLCNLGGALAMQGRLDEADASFAEGLPIAERLGWRHSIALFRAGMGGVRMRRHDFEGAVQHYRRSAEDFETLGDPYQHFRQLVSIARCLFQGGKYEESRTTLQHAMARPEIQRYQNPLSQAYLLLSQIEETLGNLAEALGALREATRMDRAAADLRFSEAMRLVELQNEVDRALREASAQRERSATLEHALDRQRELQATVERLANTDALTGINNRRRCAQLLEHEYGRCRRGGHPLAVALLDVDHFKCVNDDHGHDVGDQVLIEVANRVQAQVRGYDLVGRWGGEEFVLVFPDTDLDGARVVLARLLSTFRSVPIGTRAGPIHITASVGVTALDSADSRTADLLRRADWALYSAKRSGRDRLVAFTAPSESE